MGLNIVPFSAQPENAVDYSAFMKTFGELIPTI